jgi:hypothetical protein
MEICRCHLRLLLVLVAQTFSMIDADWGQASIDPNLSPGSRFLTRHHAFFVLPNEVTVNNDKPLCSFAHPYEKVRNYSI